jgi:hypothetical protein
MMKSRIFVNLTFLVLILSCVHAFALERGPVAISPGSDAGIARVEMSCPTFSWTGMEWAIGYRVVVFETSGPNILSYEEMASISSPALKREIQGRALSWTPSSEERLNNGEMYVWYVQAVDGYGTGIWSEGRMFKVEAKARLIGIEEAVKKSLRDHGVSEDVIEGALEDMRLGMNEIVVLGMDTEGSEIGTQDKLEIQGTEGTSNTIYGLGAGSRITADGYSNSFFGRRTGYYTTSGDNNTFMGYQAGYYNTTGYSNTFMGYRAGEENINGSSNTFVGYYAGFYNNSGFYNTFIGHSAGIANTTGSNNTFIGYQAGHNNSTGEYNVFLGSRAGYHETGSDRLYIDNSNTSSPLIWGDFASNILTVHGKLGIGTKSPAYQMELETTGENAVLLLDRTDGAVTGFSASGDKCAFGTLTNHPLWMVINGAFQAIFHTDGSLQMMNGAWCTAAGKWQDASSRELKENIQSLTAEDAREALKGLEPIRFNYKADKEDESLGFIAEDVPELVASKDRKSMSAMDVVAVLTKVMQEQQEMIKKQKNVAQEQQKAIAKLERRIDALEQRK